MAKDDWLYEAEGYEPPSMIRITHVERDDVRRPGLRCAEMTVRAMRERSKTARNGYSAAARWFALTPVEM